MLDYTKYAEIFLPDLCFCCFVGFFLKIYYFIYTNVLPTCMYVNHVCLVPMDLRTACQIP